ncbi:MAG: hypothetical protein ACXQTW_00675 [Candidatus Methanospirareceae archaeon]
MKSFATFSISNGKVLISMQSDEEIKKLIEGLRKLGVDVDVEYSGLCG